MYADTCMNMTIDVCLKLPKGASGKVSGELTFRVQVTAKRNQDPTFDFGD